LGRHRDMEKAKNNIKLEELVFLALNIYEYGIRDVFDRKVKVN